MNNRMLSAVLGLLALSVPATAGEMSMPMSHGAETSGTKASPEASENAAAMKTMMTEMDVPPSGNADKDFARMMLAHHRGAIAMAKVELSYGKDPAMRTLATGIIKAQEAEITQMQAWLAKH